MTNSAATPSQIGYYNRLAHRLADERGEYGEQVNWLTISKAEASTMIDDLKAYLDGTGRYSPEAEAARTALLAEAAAEVAAAEVAAAERRQATADRLSAAAAQGDVNQQALDAEGNGHLTGQARKRRLKKLREKGVL